jgi:hypothetical protein
MLADTISDRVVANISAFSRIVVFATNGYARIGAAVQCNVGMTQWQTLPQDDISLYTLPHDQETA